MPTEDWPSFHWRPSTTRTFFPLSSSTRQKPTTDTNDFGSAPAVSPERSTVVGWAARPGGVSAAMPNATMVAAFMLLLMLMDGLLYKSRERNRRRAAASPPGERNQRRQPAQEPGQRPVRARDQ